MNASVGESFCDYVRKGNIHKVRELLENPGLDINYQTALYEAIDNGHSDIVKLFLKNEKINVNLGWVYKKMTPLHYCCKNGKTFYVKLLLQHPKIDISLKDLDGKIAEDYALSKTIKKYIQDYKDNQ